MTDPAVRNCRKPDGKELYIGLSARRIVCGTLGDSVADAGSLQGNGRGSRFALATVGIAQPHQLRPGILLEQLQLSRRQRCLPSLNSAFANEPAFFAGALEEFLGTLFLAAHAFHGVIVESGANSLCLRGDSEKVS